MSTQRPASQRTRLRPQRKPGACPALAGAVALAGAAAFGCGTESAASVGVTELHIIASDGTPPQGYRVIVALSDGRTLAVSCPGDDRDGLRCTDEGALVTASSTISALSVKARGTSFWSLEGTRPAGNGPIDVELVALPPFRQNADFVTGFPPETGLETYLEMAHEAPSELGPAHAVKFYIDGLATSPEVYFQNTRQHPLHYDFARDVLGVPLTLDEFERATYSGDDRSAMAGTLVYYPELSFESAALPGELGAPLTLNFFPSDDLGPELVLTAHRLLEERLGLAELDGAERRLSYLPAGAEQDARLAGSQPSFSTREALWATRAELYGGVELQILNPGLAYGTLRLLTPEALETSVVSSTDIVVLTRLPNDLPIVAGSITEELQTPLAHVNVAARARNTPNIALLSASTDPRVAPFLGELVRFEVAGGGFGITSASMAEAEGYWESQRREPFVPSYDLTLEGLPSFDELGFADAALVGVKAANLAELHHLLGVQAPHGFAVPFSAYDRFMKTARPTAGLCDEARTDCTLEGREGAPCDAARELCAASALAGASLEGHVDRLLADVAFGADTLTRDACLDGLMYLIARLPLEESFALALDARVAEIFGDAQVRLRSSTNGEDLEQFSGAGLYESVSAFAAGDERASVRIGRVWASVWSFKAFEERRYWNVDHRAVRMGVAVNQAFDDELANGVLITQNIGDPATAGMYVNVQLGEISVTNPEGGAAPEVFAIVPAPGGGVQVARQRYSSLSPEEPLMSDAEVAGLFAAASRVQRHFAPLYAADAGSLALDLEFKLVAPDRAVMIKQVRPYVQR